MTTPDGWELMLHRLGGRSEPRATPVLLLHGFGANGHCLMNERGPSLAHHLARRRFDVWLLEFRGTRTSRHRGGRRARSQITLDHKVEQDLPAAVACVLDRTGASRIDLVGFSLGGTIAYAWAGGAGQQTLRRLVTLAAPLRFDLPLPARWLARLARSLPARSRLRASLPLRSFTEAGARTGIVFPARSHFNLANVQASVLRDMMRLGTEDASLAELCQLVALARPGGRVSRDGSTEYGDRLAGLTGPLLLIGGSVDEHVRPAALAEVLERAGSGVKQLRVVGRSAGARSDYGHTDLLLGPHAPHDVFGLVEAWLGAEEGALETTMTSTPTARSIPAVDRRSAATTSPPQTGSAPAARASTDELLAFAERHPTRPLDRQTARWLLETLGAERGRLLDVADTNGRQLVAMLFAEMANPHGAAELWILGYRPDVDHAALQRALAWGEREARRSGARELELSLPASLATAHPVLERAGMVPAYRLRTMELDSLSDAAASRYEAPSGLRWTGLTAETVDSLYACHRAAFARVSGTQIPDLATYRTLMLAAEPPLRVLLDGTTVVAYARVVLLDAASRRGEVRQIGRHPDAAHPSLGRAALAEALRTLAGMGACRACLEVASDNPRASALYERAGFVTVHESTVYRKTLPEPPSERSSDG